MGVARQVTLLVGQLRAVDPRGPGHLAVVAPDGHHRGFERPRPRLGLEGPALEGLQEQLLAHVGRLPRGEARELRIGPLELPERLTGSVGHEPFARMHRIGDAVGRGDCGALAPAAGRERVDDLARLERDRGDALLAGEDQFVAHLHGRMLHAALGAELPLDLARGPLDGVDRAAVGHGDDEVLGQHGAVHVAVGRYPPDLAAICSTQRDHAVGLVGLVPELALRAEEDGVARGQHRVGVALDAHLGRPGDHRLGDGRNFAATRSRRPAEVARPVACHGWRIPLNRCWRLLVGRAHHLFRLRSLRLRRRRRGTFGRSGRLGRRTHRLLLAAANQAKRHQHRHTQRTNRSTHRHSSSGQQRANLTRLYSGTWPLSSRTGRDR